MFEVEILIPLASNAGAPFTGEHFETWEARLSELFGGATRLESPANGVWLDGQQLYRDSLTRYVVALRSIADGGKVAEAVHFAKAHFDQLAIYVRFLGHAEVI